MNHLNLTARQIAEAFPDESLTIGVKQLRHINRQLKSVRDHVKFIHEFDCSDADKAVALEFLKYSPLSLLGNYSIKLKRIIALAENPPDPAIKPDIDSDKIEQAKRVPLADLYQFEKVRRFGKKTKALCPFHSEKTGSFIIDQHNKFHCFGCGAHGTSIDFLMRQGNYTFKEAVKYLVGGI